MSRTTPLSYGVVMQDLHLPGQFAVNPATTTGLTFGFLTGKFSEANSIVTVATGTVALTDNTVNYVYLNDSGVMTVATSKATSGKNLLYIVTTASVAMIALLSRST